MTLSAAVTGLLMLAAFAVFHWLRILHLTRAILALVGTCLVGEAGWASRLSAGGAAWLTHITGSATGFLFGAVAPGLLFLVLAIVFIHDLRRRVRHPRTGWIGLALGLILIAGATGIPALRNLPHDLRHGVHNTTTAVVKGTH